MKKIISIVISMIIAFYPTICISEQNRANELFDNIIDNATKCAANKNDRLEKSLCFIRAAPKKCEKEMIKFISDRDEERSSTYQRELFICVATCADASIYSKTFGECSRE